MPRNCCLVFLLAAMVACSCSKPPLTPEDAKIALEASPDFQPNSVKVTLTPDEIERGIAAGYWLRRTGNKSDPRLPALELLTITPIGSQYFRGAVVLANPRISVNQKLGARVIEIKEIQNLTGNSKEKTVAYTWAYRFEYALPELAELFKDQPAIEAKKSFIYGTNGWELKP